MDAFFNASVDAGIALASFVIAVEATGLGCCPISTFRNDAQAVSDLLELPDHVFSVAGLALGYPKDGPKISPRLTFRTSVNLNHFSEATLKEDVESYDAHRALVHPYATQQGSEKYGISCACKWSMDKTRQYSLPERADLAAFIKGKGFKLD